MEKKRIVTAVTAAAVLACLAGCGRTKVDLNDYLTLEPSGFDTAGKVSVSIDYDSLVNDNRKAFGLSDNAGEEEEIGVMMRVEEYVTGDLDKYTELSNGDTVTYTWNVNEARLEELFPIDVVCDNKTLEIDGLEEAEKLDPFDPSFFNTGKEDGVNVVFQYVSPKAEARVENNAPSSEPASKLRYYVEPDTGLEKGQEVEIKVVPDYDFDALGYVLTSESMTYKCDDIDTYLTSLDDIGDDKLQELLVQCEELVKERDASPGLAVKMGDGSWELAGEMGHFSNLKFTRAYMLTPKEPFEYMFDAEEVGDYMSNPDMMESGLVICFTCDLDKAKGVWGCCFAADTVVKSDGTYDFGSWGLKANNMVYENETAFKTGFIDWHLEKYDCREMEIK